MLSSVDSNADVKWFEGADDEDADGANEGADGEAVDALDYLLGALCT